MTNESNLAWTLQSVRVALLDGKDPRDIGGEDARINKPLPRERYLPTFLRELHIRAEALCHTVMDWATDSFQRIATGLRESPFALETVGQKVEDAVQAVRAKTDGHLSEIAAEIGALKERAEVAAITYRRDLQGAKATHPRGGWPDSMVTLLAMLGILLLETALSALWLRHALGLPKATGTGLAFSLAALGGGGLAAFSLLRPTRHDRSTGWNHAVQWISAVSIALLVTFFIYVGACYRAALLDGLDGDYADLRAKFFSPGEVLLNFDVLALVLLGLGGFVVGVFKISSYYHGHRPLLRKSGVAKTLAHEALVRRAAVEKAVVVRAVDDGSGLLDEIGHSNAEWARAIASHADEAGLIAIEANRRIELVRLVFPTCCAEYCDGHNEVKPADGFDAMPSIAIGIDVDVPGVIDAARKQAIADARLSAATILEGRNRLTQIRAAAITRIDRMAGLTQANHNLARLPLGGS